jgi:outer membrane protein assembly factor BamB
MTQSAMLAISPGGSLKWAYDLVGDFSSSTALSEDGVIYINWDDGFLYAINSDGSLKWTAAAGGRSSPAIGADGVVYAGGLDFRLHALNPDGTQLWVSAPAGGEFSDPAIANDGTLVVGCADGWIRAYGD